MIDIIINSHTGFSLITILFLSGIIFNGVGTYHDTRESSKSVKFFMYVLHILVCGLSVKGYLVFLSFVDFSKIIG